MVPWPPNNPVSTRIGAGFNFAPGACPFGKAAIHWFSKAAVLHPVMSVAEIPRLTSPGLGGRRVASNAAPVAGERPHCLIPV
jgi:hypothetical protein